MTRLYATCTADELREYARTYRQAIYAEGWRGREGGGAYRRFVRDLDEVQAELARRDEEAVAS